jgi:hypothetical protein
MKQLEAKDSEITETNLRKELKEAKDSLETQVIEVNHLKQQLGEAKTQNEVNFVAIMRFRIQLAQVLQKKATSHPSSHEILSVTRNTPDAVIEKNTPRALEEDGEQENERGGREKGNGGREIMETHVRIVRTERWR